MAYIEKKKKTWRKKSHVKVDERQEVYQSSLWRKMRLCKLREAPLCEVCLMQGTVTPGDHVHHLKSFMGASDKIERDLLAYDPQNLMTVCDSCHGRIHGGDLKGCEDADSIKKRLAES